MTQNWPSPTQVTPDECTEGQLLVGGKSVSSRPLRGDGKIGENAYLTYDIITLSEHRQPRV